MPYTREEILKSDRYKDILESARKERQTKLQIEYQNMSLSGSREGASPTTRLEDGTILSYPADETEDGANFKQSTGEFVKVDKKSYTVDSDKLTDVIDTKITELTTSRKASITVEEFFEQYELLRDEIVEEGENSHRYLFDSSAIYLDITDNELEELKRSLESQIAQLAEQQALLTAQIETQAVDIEEDNAYEEYVAGMLTWKNSATPYNIAEWRTKGMPVASEMNAWGRLSFSEEPRSIEPSPGSPGKTELVIKYGGLAIRKRNRTLRGDPYKKATFQTTARGDDSLSLVWLESGKAINSDRVTVSSNQAPGGIVSTIQVRNAKKAGDQKDRYNLSCKATDRSGTVESTQVVVKERIITGG